MRKKFWYNVFFIGIFVFEKIYIESYLIIEENKITYNLTIFIYYFYQNFINSSS